MTEHAAVIFVFFFLAEYASIVLICILITVLFLGGYLLDLNFINTIFESLVSPTENLNSLLVNLLEVNKSGTNETTLSLVDFVPKLGADRL